MSRVVRKGWSIGGHWNCPQGLYRGGRNIRDNCIGIPRCQVPEFPHPRNGRPTGFTGKHDHRLIRRSNLRGPQHPPTPPTSTPHTPHPPPPPPPTRCPTPPHPVTIHPPPTPSTATPPPALTSTTPIP